MRMEKTKKKNRIITTVGLVFFIGLFLFSGYMFMTEYMDKKQSAEELSLIHI